ncbi:MAG: 30S ribosomal protein S24e [Archaeoglobaceae archaeon]
MEVTVEKDNQNHVLRRKEVHFKVKFDAQTPSRRDLKQKLAGLYATNSENVVIDYVKSEFGMGEANSYAKIYDNTDDLKKFESKHIIKRNTPEAAAEGEGE